MHASGGTRKRGRKVDDGNSTEEDPLDGSPRRQALVVFSFNTDMVEGHTRERHKENCSIDLAAAFAPDVRGLHIARMVLDKDADVIALQEVDVASATKGSAFRGAFEAAGCTLAAQAYCPLVVVPSTNRGTSGDDWEPSTKLNLTSRRYIQLWVREREGYLTLMPRSGGEKKILGGCLSGRAWHCGG